MTESRSRSGEQFGRKRLAELFTETAEEGLTHPETTRRLTHAILRHQAGGLQDDATIVLIVWLGPPGSEQEGAV
jgi:serine phosphatase RsbU (regulator of sigma subunit)